MDPIDEVEERALARIGSVLNGKWTIDSVLGVGGMASVFAATHRNRNRAALKMLHMELSTNREIRERFLREGYISNSVGHPGAVRVHDDEVAEDGSAYIVMELIEGESLETRVARKGGNLPAEEVLSLMDQVLDTLASAHDNGITHRDIKPDNLFLDRSTVVKVLDFGIARLKESGRSGGTKTGRLLGTPAYMAPEQARGRWNDVDAQTDLWAIAATAFSLISGRLVHEAETLNETLARAMQEPAPPIASVMPGIPVPVADWSDKGVAFEKSDRFEDARAMQDALREAYASSFGSEARDALLSLPDSSSRSFGGSPATLSLEDVDELVVPIDGDSSRPTSPLIDGMAGVPIAATSPNPTLTTSSGVVTSSGDLMPNIRPRASRGTLLIGAAAVLAVLGMAFAMSDSEDETTHATDTSPAIATAAPSAKPASVTPPVAAPARPDNANEEVDSEDKEVAPPAPAPVAIPAKAKKLWKKPRNVRTWKPKPKPKKAPAYL